MGKHLQIEAMLKYISKKKNCIFIFHNSPKTFLSQPVSPDKLSLNGNREASRDVSSGDSLILPGTGNSMWKAVDSPQMLAE